MIEELKYNKKDIQNIIKNFNIKNNNINTCAGYEINIHSTVNAYDIYQEINQPTTDKTPIIGGSVLPTINGGFKVLKTILRGTKTLNDTEGDVPWFASVGGAGPIVEQILELV